MNEELAKYRQYRILIYLLAFIMLFEIGMLAYAIPVKTTFITITISALGFLSLYLIILCLRLVRELKQKSINKD